VNCLEADDGPLVLFGLGLFTVLLSLFIYGGFLGVFYFGSSWIISAIIYKESHRVMTGGGFLAALLFGFIGAIIWIIIDMSRSQRHYETDSRYQEVEKEDLKCGNCMWFGKGCPRKEKLLNAQPCPEFRLKLH